MDPTIIYGRIVEALHHHRDVLVPDLFWESDATELRKELLSSFTAGRINRSTGFSSQIGSSQIGRVDLR